MAEQAVVHIGENSPEQVAFKLTEVILTRVEKKPWADLTREEVLDTYSACLDTVKGYRRVRQASEKR
jgi:hypothetical protein